MTRLAWLQEDQNWGADPDQLCRTARAHHNQEHAQTFKKALMYDQKIRCSIKPKALFFVASVH
jgi:hypothetical protein